MNETLERSNPQASRPVFPLSAPLLRVSSRDQLTIKDAFEGIHVFGGLGSGKSTGSGKSLAHAFLRSGFGGLVLAAKTDEVQTWVEYAEKTGRQASVLKFGPEDGEHFNFIRYEMQRPGAGAGIASNLVNLFEQVLEIQSPGKVVGGDPYWRQARAQLMRNAIELVQLARGEVDFDDVAAVIRSAPLTRQEVRDPDWRNKSVCARCLAEAFDKVKESGNPQDIRSLSVIAAYFQEEFAGLDPDPRSSVVSMVGALTDMLLRGPLHTMFMTRTTFIPELLYSGTVIILNMPVHEYNDAGKFAQVLFKTIVQRMLERRSDLDHKNPDTARPIFLWADEAQFFATPQDTMFQTTARSSRVATVYMTQNLPNYYDAFGADSGGRDRAKKLLGAFGIKIFHANGDLETNEYAERLFGKHHVWRESHGTNESETWGKSSGGGGVAGSSSYSRTLGSSRNWTQVLESQYQAKVLTELRRGGRERGFTEAILFRAGDVWKATNTNILPLRFPQEPYEAITAGGGGSA